MPGRERSPRQAGSPPLRPIFTTALRRGTITASRRAFLEKFPARSTQFSASYKWINGTALSRLDAFGEAAYQIDPNLHLSIRQPLPGFSGRWEALADFSNLLAQGYVTVNGQDSRMHFVPILRSFRGGVSFQF